MTQPQGALLVGSMNYPDAEATFRASASILGDHLKRIPDGEVGDRFHWICFQPDIIAKSPGLERVGNDPVWLKHLDQRQLRIGDGVDPADLALPPLGYADAALESWEVFRALREEGQIPEGTRFQVSLPTPFGVVAVFIAAEDRAAFEPVYAAALFRELNAILDGIPHDSLAIQWDVAVEFGCIEAQTRGTSSAGSPEVLALDKYRPWFDDVWQGFADRAVVQAASVPLEVEVGFHLCYGDSGEKHFVEPADTANLVQFTRLLLSTSPRRIDWVHMPVPIERDDDAYFLPLESLVVPKETEIYLGLVHREDGIEGARRRSAVAGRYLDRYGVATECGCGRAPAAETVPLLETHRAIAAAW